MSKITFDSIENINVSTENISTVHHNTYSEIRQAQSDEREKTYTKILETFYEDYRKRSDKKRELKSKFFWCVISLFFVVACGCIASVILAVVINVDNLIGIIITICASMLGTTISLVIVVAKHLFPEEDDKNISELISSFFDHDIK